MRKTDKKIDKQLRDVLSNICEQNLKSIVGFQWLTHLVSFSNFPSSLKIICVFDSKDNLDDFAITADSKQAISTIQQQLLANKIKINSQQISFQTEANFKRLHG